jgi:hypothetical protein
MILKIDHSIHDINLEPFLQYGSPDTKGYLILGAGVDQYKLLACLSKQLPLGSRVGDLGTFYGNSAIALASNPGISVLTCDTTDHVRGECIGYKNMGNIGYQRCPAIELLPLLINAALIVVDIGLHTGPLEQEVLDYLIAHRYKGIAVFDDIHYSEGMKAFWNNIKLKKFDVTPVGHWSGSGIVVFDPSTIDVEVNL